MKRVFLFSLLVFLLFPWFFTNGSLAKTTLNGRNIEPPLTKDSSEVPSNIPINTFPGHQGYGAGPYPHLDVVSDGQGGAYITWEDHFSGNIHIQRIDKNDQELWGENGIPVAPGNWYQINPRLASDLNGGVIVTWADGRLDTCTPFSSFDCDIYAQRFDSDGNIMWQEEGVPIVIHWNNQGNNALEIVSDGLGGAIIAWNDNRDSSRWIFANRISEDGQVLWFEPGFYYGMLISSETQRVEGGATQFEMISDGAGGAIVTFKYANEFPYAAQRVDSNGHKLWGDKGVTITEEKLKGNAISTATDGYGGFLVVWEGASGLDSSNELFVQRYNSNGIKLWQEPGLIVASGENLRATSDIVSDGEGGAIITWADERNASSDGYCYSFTYGESENCDIYAQRVSSSGAILWTPNGVPISTAKSRQWMPQLASDGLGGAYIVWRDCRYYPKKDWCMPLYRESNVGADIYFQWIDKNGEVQWHENGSPVTIADDMQGWDSGTQSSWTYAVVPMSNGEVLVVWPDARNRSESGFDVYAQRLTPSFHPEPGGPPNPVFIPIMIKQTSWHGPISR